MKALNMKTLSSTILLAAGLSLTACGPMPENRTLNSVHQPVVSRTNYALDLYTTGSGALPVQEQQKLTDWFNAMDLGYGDRVSVENPAGNAAAFSMVEAITSRHGLLVSDQAPVTSGAVAPGAMRVIVTRSSARVPGCPDWSYKGEANFNNATSRNFGCAINGNIAAMVADPEDLVSGKQGDGNMTVTTGNKAINTYRDATPTGGGGLKESSTAGGGS